MRRGFTIHHNGPPLGLLEAEHTDCARKWAGICRYHAGKFGSKWSQSVYSFAVCPHGVRFIGQGWDRPQAANGSDKVGADDGADAYWFTVCVLIGTDEKPPQAMADAVADLIHEGREMGRCGTRVLPHNAFKQKACPGPEFTVLAATWDNAPVTKYPAQGDDDTMSLYAALLENLWHEVHGESLTKTQRKELAQAQLTLALKPEGERMNGYRWFRESKFGLAKLA